MFSAVLVAHVVRQRFIQHADYFPQESSRGSTGIHTLDIFVPGSLADVLGTPSLDLLPECLSLDRVREEFTDGIVTGVFIDKPIKPTLITPERNIEGQVIGWVVVLSTEFLDDVTGHTLLRPVLHQRVKLLLPHATIETQAGLGHLAHEEDPATNAAAILRYANAWGV